MTDPTETSASAHEITVIKQHPMIGEYWQSHCSCGHYASHLWGTPEAAELAGRNHVTETSAGEAVAAELTALLPRLPRVKITPQTISQTIIDRWYGYETEYRQTIAKLRTEVAAATAECTRVTKRAEFLDSTLDAMRQQAVEAVKERNAATERAVKAEAALERSHQMNRGVAKDLMRTMERATAAEQKLAELRTHAADEHGRLSQDLDNAEEVVRLRDELSKVAELNRDLVNEASDAQTALAELREQADLREAAHDEFAELYARASTELAKLRERIGEGEVQWTVALDGENGSPLPEKLARRMAGDRRVALKTRTVYRNPPWREVPNG